MNKLKIMVIHSKILTVILIKQKVIIIWNLKKKFKIFKMKRMNKKI